MLQKTRLIFYRQTFFSALYEKAANFDLRLSKESLTQKRNPNDVTFIYHHLSDSPKTLVKVFPLKKKKTLTLCEKVSRHLLPFSSSSFTSLVSVISISLSSTIFTPSAATGRPSFTACCLKSQTLYRKPNKIELEFTYWRWIYLIWLCRDSLKNNNESTYNFITKPVIMQHLYSDRLSYDITKPGSTEWIIISFTHPTVNLQ